MEELFNNSTIMIYFFAILAIYNYEKIEEVQSIAIIYILLYSMLLFNKDYASLWVVLILLIVSLICVLEFLTRDKEKFKLLSKPHYKLIDCLVRGILQYKLLWIILSFCSLVIMRDFFQMQIWIQNDKVRMMIGCIISGIILLLSINSMLQESFKIASITKMTKVFNEYPINEFAIENVNEEALQILVDIEDATYWERKSTTYLSVAMLRYVIDRRIGRWSSGWDRKKEAFHIVGRYLRNTISRRRGYSTIQMQLVRSIGIEDGYEKVVCRKIFEIIYTPIFLRSILMKYKKNQVANQEEWKSYLLYIYMLSVNTFLGEIRFLRFYKAFDFYGKNLKDISHWSAEGVFIACLGLSKRAIYLDEFSVDYYIDMVSVGLDRDLILEMSEDYDNNPGKYNGEYLI